MSEVLGSQLPMFAIAALVLVVAVIAAVLVVRRSGKRARGEGGTRGRQAPRLAMTESTPIIDGRKLVIVRRDDVEHLVLIGGATDVLIEANIRRSEAVDAIPAQPRESAPRIVPAEVSRRVATAEVRTAAPEAQEAATEVPVAEAARPAPEAPLRSPIAETPAIEPVSARAPAVEPARAVLDEPAPPLAAEPAKEQPASVPTDHFAELAAALQRPPAADTKAPPARQAAAAAGNDDQNLTDMAHRLEAALRRPVSSAGPGFVSMRSEPRRSFSTAGPRLNPSADLRGPPRAAGEPRLAPEPRLVPEPRVVAAEPRVSPEPRASAEPKLDPSEDKPAFESLEREMASLLGRSPR